MALQDYADLDEDDFYGQDFDEDGVVSVWVGLDNLPSWPAETDLLQDLCGVGDYNPDKQDTYWSDDPVELSGAVSALSWTESFKAAVIDACGERNITRVCWVVCQFDFR